MAVLGWLIWAVALCLSGVLLIRVARVAAIKAYFATLTDRGMDGEIVAPGWRLVMRRIVHWVAGAYMTFDDVVFLWSWWPKKNYSDPAVDGEWATKSTEELAEGLLRWGSGGVRHEVLARRGEAAVPYLLRALKDRDRVAGKNVPELLQYVNRFEALCRAVTPYGTVEVLDALKPYLTFQDGRFKKAALRWIARLGFWETAETLRVELRNERERAIKPILWGLEEAQEAGQLEKRLIMELFEELGAGVENAGIEQREYTMSLGLLVWADARRAAQMYLTREYLNAQMDRRAWVVSAFCGHRELFPTGMIRELYEEAAGLSNSDPHMLSFLCDARAEGMLIKRMEEAAPEARRAWREALVERYVRGVCHEDPGPELSGEEQVFLDGMRKKRLMMENIRSFIWGDGVDQLLDESHKREWEGCLAGLEMVGAVKSVGKCREMLGMFGALMQGTWNGEEWVKEFQRIKTENIEQYCMLEQEMFDCGEDVDGLFDAYFIKYRDLFLRNRRNEGWKRRCK